MASFVGTRKEFKRFIGPRLRNLVNIHTKGYRIGVANCNHCGSSEHLESAHVRGRERNQIIDGLLEQFTYNDVVTIDLAMFEQLFVAEHDPIEKTILILCRYCHSKYDAVALDSELVIGDETAPAHPELHSSNVSVQLPIYLVPSDPATFKRELLRTRKARIKITYVNGREQVKSWNVSNFSSSSNVLGNLRSRPEFRRGKWQQLGIEKVTVEVVDLTP